MCKALSSFRSNSKARFPTLYFLPLILYKLWSYKFRKYDDNIRKIYKNCNFHEKKAKVFDFIAKDIKYNW